MASKRNVRLRYEFEFDPNELWSRKSEFESFIGKALSAIRVEGEFIDFVGLPNESVVRLSRIEEPPVPKGKPRLKEVKDQLKSVMKKAK